MTNILEFKKKEQSPVTVGEISIQVETQKTDDGFLWMRAKDLKTDKWGEWFRVVDHLS